MSWGKRKWKIPRKNKRITSKREEARTFRFRQTLTAHRRQLPVGVTVLSCVDAIIVVSAFAAVVEVFAANADFTWNKSKNGFARKEKDTKESGEEKSPNYRKISENKIRKKKKKVLLKRGKRLISKWEETKTNWKRKEEIAEWELKKKNERQKSMS